LQWANQIGSLQKKKEKGWTWKQKHNNKYPQNKRFKTATKEKSWKLDLGARS
jgi:hypothetical protein